MSMPDPTFEQAPRRALTWAFGLNGSVFVCEIAVALIIGSVALFADSMDFLEDTILYGLALLALGWSQRGQARASLVLALLMAVPGVLALMAAVDKYMDPIPPDAMTMGIVGALALAVNVVSAIMLAASRDDSTVLRAAWLSASTDVIANVLVILAAVLVARWTSAWPDIVAGLGIVALHGRAAWKIGRAALRDLGFSI